MAQEEPPAKDFEDVLSYEFSRWEEDIETIVRNSKGYRCHNKYIDWARTKMQPYSLLRRSVDAQAMMMDLSEKYVRKLRQGLSRDSDPRKEYITLPYDNLEKVHLNAIKIVERYARMNTFYANKEPHREVEGKTIIYVKNYDKPVSTRVGLPIGVESHRAYK